MYCVLYETVMHRQIQCQIVVLAYIVVVIGYSGAVLPCHLVTGAVAGPVVSFVEELDSSSRINHRHCVHHHCHHQEWQGRR